MALGSCCAVKLCQGHLREPNIRTWLNPLDTEAFPISLLHSKPSGWLIYCNLILQPQGKERRERELYCDREQEGVGGKGKRRGERGPQRRRDVA